MAEQLSQEEEKEAEEVEQRSAPTSKVVHAAVAEDGKEALGRPSSALFYSALAAGMSMSFSMLAEALLGAALPDEVWKPAVTKLGYCVGFLIVILGRQQLYTESTLSPLLPVLERSEGASVTQLLRVWALALVGNLIGIALVAWSMMSTAALGAEVQSELGELGRKALEADFGTVVLRGIFAGWLIALMVWLLPFAESARIWVIVILTYVVGMGHFSHVIAGSGEVFALAASGEETWGTALLHFTLPAFIGNTIGGVVLVALLAHAQVKSGEK
jgi:formate/nitrite transporter FocA (FNT family)